MKKENDEITDLFRARLADTGMNVRDGFWEELSQDIPVLVNIVVGSCSSVWRLRRPYCLFWQLRRPLSCISHLKKRWRKRLPR